MYGSVPRFCHNGGKIMLYDVRKYEIPLCTLDGHAPFGVFKLRIHESPDSTPVVLQPVRPDQPSKSQPAEPAAPKQQQIVVEKSVEKPLPKPQPAVKPAPELTEKTSNNAPLKTTELITNDEYDDENSRRKMTKSVRFVDEAVESQPLNESFSIEPLITELKKVASDINRSSSESTKLQLESVMDAVNDLKFRLHEDLQNMHVEMLRQFQQQQEYIDARLSDASAAAALRQELAVIKEENRKLRTMMGLT